MSVATVVALVLVATAVALAFPAAAGRKVRAVRWRESAVSGRLGATLGASAVGSAWWVLGGRHVALAVIAIGTLFGIARLAARSRANARADARAERVLAVTEGIAADLAAGQPPLAALRRAVEEWPEFGPVAAAGELDADVPVVLRQLAVLPGAGQLRAVAAAWQVAHRSGAPMAPVLDRIAGSLRADRQTARLVATELASARATARLMAVLPVLVLALGLGVGSEPIAFLTGTSIGIGCLAAGLALCWLGLAWLERIADSVLERR